MWLEDNGHTVYYSNEEEVQDHLKNVGEFMAVGGVRIYPENILVPASYTKIAEKVYNFKFRSTDVLVQGYPKSGTTWMQEILWQMINNPNGDHPDTNKELYIKSPYFEFDLLGGMKFFSKDKAIVEQVQLEHPAADFEKEDLLWIDLLQAKEGGRIMKSHIPPTLLPPDMLETAKVVYMIRNPKDVCVSFYSHMKTLAGFNFEGSLEVFANAFLEGKVMYGGMLNLIRQWLPYRNHKNVHFVFYEDLKMNTMTESKKLDEFLGSKLTDEQLERVKHRTSFGEVKKQKTFLNASSTSDLIKKGTDESGGFYRKGIIGDSKKKLSPELHKKFDEHFREAFKALDLPYDY